MTEVTIARLTLERIDALVGEGVFPFGDCPACGCYPTTVTKLADGFIGTCGRCGRRLAESDVVFLDKVAAARRGWLVGAVQ